MPPEQANQHSVNDKMLKPKFQLHWIPLLVTIMFFCAFLQGYLSGISVGEKSYQANGKEIVINNTPKASGDTEKVKPKSIYISMPQMRAVLSDDESNVYDSIATAIREFNDQATFTVRSETAVSMERVIEIARIAQETPEFFWVESITWCTWVDNSDDTRTYTLDITYWMTQDERNTYLPLLNARLSLIKSQFESQLVRNNIISASEQVNEYLAYNTVYVQDKSEQLKHPYDTILGPLIFRQAICSGYAKTYCYLMSMLGYESAYCLGYTNDNIFHAWNAIRDNETLYYTDTTFNSTSGNSEKWTNLIRSDFGGHNETEKYWYQ